MDREKQKENEFTSRSEMGLMGFNNYPNPNNIQHKNINNEFNKEYALGNLGSPEIARDDVPRINRNNNQENNYNRINNFSNIDDLSKFGTPGETPSIIHLNPNDNPTDNNISNINFLNPNINQQIQSNNHNNNQNFNNHNNNNQNFNNHNNNNQNFNSHNNNKTQNNPNTLIQKFHEMNFNDQKFHNDNHNNPNHNKNHIQENHKNLPPRSEKTLTDDRKRKIYAEKNTKIQWCFNIFHIIIFILIIVCMQINYFSVANLTFAELSHFESIIDTWLSSPIINVTISCNTKHTKFISDFWEGTVNGCQCGEELFRGICSGRIRNQLRCSSIPMIEPMPFDLWKKTQICTERIPGIYFDLIIVSSPSNCPKNTQSCGIIDSFNNYLCYDITKPCPYNKFSTDIKQRKRDDKVLMFPDSSNLLFGRENTNDKILFHMKVGFDQPCKNSYYENLDFQVYALNYYFGKQKCYSLSDGLYRDQVVYDSNYIKIDNYLGQELYKENGIVEQLAKIPNYIISEYERNIYLYGTNYFGLKVKCLDKIRSENKIDKLLVDLKKFITIDNSYGSFITGLLCEFFLISTIAILICYFNRKINTMGRIQPSDMNWYIYFFILDFLLMFIYFLVGITYAAKLNVSDDINYIFGITECVEPYTMVMFSHFMTLMNKCRMAAYIMSFLILFQLLSWLGFVIYCYKSLSKFDFYPI
jgi:hypothetical protein